MESADPKKRQQLLRQLLIEGKSSTQEELADDLRRNGFDITQSTISRDLRKIGAIKTINPNGETVYKLSAEPQPLPSLSSTGLQQLLVDIRHNGSMIVIHTTVGSASLVAAHFDRAKISGILGTIAGDDTIFVAPASPAQIERIIGEIRELV